MPYWQLFYHLVWATQHGEPRLTPELAPAVHADLRTRAQSLGGTVFAVNGLADHVHLAVAIPPKIAIAHFVGQVKNWTSARVNRRLTEGDPRFTWQEDYGVFSFDRRRLANLIAYVEDQPEHHAQGSTIPILERWAGGPIARFRQLDAAYHVDSEAWRNEMLLVDTVNLDEGRPPA